MIETAKFYIKTLVWITLAFVQGHSCMKKKKNLCLFSRKITINLDDIQSVVTTDWFVKAHTVQVMFKKEKSADVIYKICV